MATVKDVAKLAGVSTATVSRALADPAKVSTLTRNKVDRAVAEIGYSPNAMARNLRRRESKTIVVILPDIANPFFSEIIHGIESIAHQQDYKILLGDAGHNMDRAVAYFDLVQSKQADGLLVLTAEFPLHIILNFKNKHRPPIVMACEYIHEISVPTVKIDNEQGAFKAVEYLLSMGHREIAAITGPMENPICADRQKGYFKALHNSDIQAQTNWIIEGDFSFQSGYNLGRQLLSTENRPTAIFCHNDEMAIGVLKIARELDISVPNKLSIVGFDDIKFSEYCEPTLTTIHQPRQLIGESAMKLMLDILKGKSVQSTITLPAQLIVRNSTAAPN